MHAASQMESLERQVRLQHLRKRHCFLQRGILLRKVFMHTCAWQKRIRSGGVALQKSGDSDNAEIEFERAEKKLIDILNSADKLV